MQKINDNGTIVLLADDGMMLTDGSCCGTTVRLGKEDDGAKWYEITAEADLPENAEICGATTPDHETM